MMARMKRCRDCGGQVSKRAKHCPHCGAPTKREIGQGTGCLIIIVFMCLFGWYMITYDENIAELGKTSSTPYAPSPDPGTRRNAQNDVDRFLDLINAIDGATVWIVDADVLMLGQYPALRITMTDLWHRQSYQERLQGAQMLQRTWSRIYSPDRPDSARIKLVDRMGNEVGGSRVIGGSVIWVVE
jgi:hypothetical protein